MEELKTKKGFKVYSWELLLLALIQTGGIIYGLFHYDGFHQVIILIAILYNTINCYKYALTREGFEENQRQSEIQKASARARLGRFAFMDGMSPIVLIGLGYLTALILPEHLKWMAIAFLVAAIAVMIRDVGDNIEKMDEETRLEKEEKARKKTEEAKLS